MSRMNGKNENRGKATPEDRKKWLEAWSAMMVDIWKEKIIRLRVIDTSALFSTVSEDGHSIGSQADVATIMHAFTLYGMFQDLGVGKEFSKDNGGDLGFTPVREPRVWFSRAYYASIMVLKEQMAYMYGEEYCGLIAEAIEGAKGKRSTTLRSQLWGTVKR